MVEIQLYRKIYLCVAGFTIMNNGRDLIHSVTYEILFFAEYSRVR